MRNPLELQIQTLPDSPGVYQYFDKDDKLLYVGKAKNLKKRVMSYFNKIHSTGRTNVMVKKIVAIKRGAAVGEQPYQETAAKVQHPA